MWIQVRTMDGKRSEKIEGLSKLTSVKDLRQCIEGKFGIQPIEQRLFYRGKQVLMVILN